MFIQIGNTFENNIENHYKLEALIKDLVDLNLLNKNFLIKYLSFYKLNIHYYELYSKTSL